jgi:hypothetical protein
MTTLIENLNGIIPKRKIKISFLTDNAAVKSVYHAVKEVMKMVNTNSNWCMILTQCIVINKGSDFKSKP